MAIAKKNFCIFNSVFILILRHAPATSGRWHCHVWTLTLEGIRVNLSVLFDYSSDIP